MKNILYLALSTICMYLNSDVSALMCYECNTFLDLDCKNLNKMSMFYHVCEPPKTRNNTVIEYKRPLCRKMKQKIKVRNDLIITKHSCGWELYKNNEEDLCYESKYEDYQEVVCQCFTDGCNSSRMESANLTLISTFGILSLLIYSRTN